MAYYGNRALFFSILIVSAAKNAEGTSEKFESTHDESSNSKITLIHEPNSSVKSSPKISTAPRIYSALENNSPNSSKTNLSSVLLELAQAQRQVSQSIERMIESNEAILKFHKLFNPGIETSYSNNSTNCSSEFECTLALRRYIHSKNKELMGIRPISAKETCIFVRIKVAVNQIVEINEAEEYIKADIHVIIDFENYQIGWDSAKFFGVKDIEINSYNEMWLPDIFPYNGIDLKSEEQYFRTVPNIHSRGAFYLDKASQGSVVSYSYSRTLKFSCSIETFYFPFDYQSCAFVFRSWFYDVDSLLLIPGLDFNRYPREDNEWIILNVTQHSRFVSDDSSNQKRFTVYEKRILLKRRPLYYIVNLLIPSLIITQMSFIGFFSPSSSDGDRTEKVNLGMATLLAMSVLLLTINGMIPVNSTYIPLTGVFFLTNMFLISAGIVVTTFIMMVDQRGKRKKRVPHRIQQVFFFKLAPAIGLKIPTIIRKTREPDIENDQMERDISSEACDESIPLSEVREVKTISEQTRSIDDIRRLKLAEVEFIFLAKILDALMLILFSICLYISAGIIIIVGWNQPMPDHTGGRDMYKSTDDNFIFFEFNMRHIAEQFVETFDANNDNRYDEEELREKCLSLGCTESFIEKAMLGYKFGKVAFNRMQLEYLMRQTLLLDFKTAVIRQFSSADKNLDRSLDKNEFVTFAEGSPPYFIGKRYSSARISINETMLEIWFSLRDANEDGLVSFVEALLFSTTYNLTEETERYEKLMERRQFVATDRTAEKIIAG